MNRTVTLKVDVYTKIVLTIIAIGLLGCAIRPLVISEKVNASSKDIQDVNIKQISGYTNFQWAKPIPVKVVKK